MHFTHASCLSADLRSCYGWKDFCIGYKLQPAASQQRIHDILSHPCLQNGKRFMILHIDWLAYASCLHIPHAHMWASCDLHVVMTYVPRQ